MVHDGKAIAVTVSVGVACAHSKRPLATPPHLLKRAEAAIRRAKQAGKNRGVTVRSTTDRPGASSHADGGCAFATCSMRLRDPSYHRLPRLRQWPLTCA